jgi:WD40 repeat protein
LDGYLRLWETAYGAHVSAIQVGSRPISACAVSPDGKNWLSGSLDGMLAHWDALTHQQVSVFMAHPRPLSAIVFNVGGRTLATASWDGNIGLWDLSRDREGRILSGHTDIVSGCRFSPDGQMLVSWSHDGTIRIWDVARVRPLADWAGHSDRITAGAVSPDASWIATGARNSTIRLWKLETREAISELLRGGGEIRGCQFLLDGQSLVTADAAGLMTLHELPSLEVQAELDTRLVIQCMALAPSSGQISVGCGDGNIRFVAVEGLETAPLLVTAMQTTRRTSTPLQRLFGKSRLQYAYHCVCPTCRQSFELQNSHPGQTAACSNCRRSLQVAAIAHLAHE